MCHDEWCIQAAVDCLIEAPVMCFNIHTFLWSAGVSKITIKKKTNLCFSWKWLRHKAQLDVIWGRKSFVAVWAGFVRWKIPRDNTPRTNVWLKVQSVPFCSVLYVGLSVTFTVLGCVCQSPYLTATSAFKITLCLHKKWRAGGGFQFAQRQQTSLQLFSSVFLAQLVSVWMLALILYMHKAVTQNDVTLWLNVFPYFVQCNILL